MSRINTPGPSFRVNRRGLKTLTSGEYTPPPAPIVGLPVPTEMLASGRLNLMGYGGASGSNGTNTDSNSRIAAWNETGTGITKLKLVFSNWYCTATTEINGFNAITVKAAVEYPSGTFTPVQFSGGASASIAVGANVLSDEVTLPSTIPADAQFWVRTYVSVTSGQKWPTGLAIRTANGEAMDLTTGVDKTTSGTITNVAGTAFGPTGIKATGFSGTPRKFSFGLLGDSIFMGAGDSVAEGAARGNIGAFAKACVGKFPCLNGGISGHAMFNQSDYSRRIDLLQKAGVNTIVANYGHNDLGGSRTNAQVIADRMSLTTTLVNAGFRVIWATIPPRTTSTDSYQTTGNQTPVTTGGGYAGGASSRRALVNAHARTNPSPWYDFVELADPVETARDSGIWGATSSFSATHLAASGTNAAATSDGLHPVTWATTAPGTGGTYILRDAISTKLNDLATR